MWLLQNRLGFKVFKDKEKNNKIETIEKNAKKNEEKKENMEVNFVFSMVQLEILKHFHEHFHLVLWKSYCN